MLAGSAGCTAAVSLYFSSQSDWLDDIKKAPELNAQEPRNSLGACLTIRPPRLDAKGTPATARALHVGVVELEPRTFDGFDVIDLNAFEVHGTHLVHRDFQTVKLENLVRIRGLVLKGHVVLETRAAAADYCHAQRDRHRRLHVHDFLDLSTCNGRQIDHSFLWPPLAGAPAMLCNTDSIARFCDDCTASPLLLRNANCRAFRQGCMLR